MKHAFKWLVVFMAASFIAACKKDDSAAAVDAPVTKAEIQQAFADAPAEVRQVAEQAATGVEGENATEAFARLQALGEVPDLTPEQRKTLARSRNAVLKQLQAGAAAGDAQAQQMIRNYQATR
jgi:hypothetical protein